MSGPLLDGQQIARLFEQAASGELPATPAADVPRARWLRTVDFTRPTKFTPDQENRLRRAHENFCRTAATKLAAEHRLSLELELIDISQHTWEDAHALVPRDALCGTLTSELTGDLLLGVELPLLLIAVERLLGAPAEEEPKERKLTDIDLVLMRRVFDVLVKALSKTWLEMAGVSFELGRLEPQPDASVLHLSSEPTLALTIEARMQRQATTIVLLIPHASVAPVAKAYSKRTDDGRIDDPGATAALRTGLGAVDVSVRAQVGGTVLSLEEVLAVRPGDIVPLGAAATEPIELCADDTVVHRARPGRSGRRRAAQIEPPPAEDPGEAWR